MKSLVLTMTLFALLGCKKEETPIKSYLRMSLNGENVECDYYIRASDYVSPSISQTQVLGIYGTWKHNKPQEGNIEIELYGFNNTPGPKPFSSPSYVRVMQVQRLGNGGAYTDAYFAGGDDVNLTIQEVSERYVKGVFDIKAKMYTGPGTYETLMITEGEFHIDRKK
jgi:hypothetical protein